MARLALAAYTPYKGPKDALGYLTAWWTDRDPDARTPAGRPWVSHVELVIDGLCYTSSAMDGGVRCKPIDLNKPHWRVVPIDWRDPAEALRVYREYEGEPYGYMDLIAQHVLRLPVDFRGPTCSELVARMLGLPRAEGLTPAWITDYCESRRTQGWHPTKSALRLQPIPRSRRSCLTPRPSPPRCPQAARATRKPKSA